ncbi:MAG: hypothetical protein ACR2OB_08450 [Solirubrobacteraceae bacterium]
MRLDEVDELVWSQVLALLENPELIKVEIERRLQTLRAEHPASHRRDGLQRDLTRAQNALRRLIDGYQEQLITLEELRARMPELRKRETTLRAELDALDAELHDAETYLKLTETLDAFRSRLSANAKQLTTEQRQEIVRLVVREVLLGDDDVTVRHSIPVPSNGRPGGSLLRSQSQGAAQGADANVAIRTGRVDGDGERLGLEIVFKDAAGKTRRRAVAGNVQDARDALASARTRRVKREAEPLDREPCSVPSPMPSRPRTSPR